MKNKIEKEKQLAAEHSTSYVSSNSIIGLGTGSTSIYAVEAIGNKLKAGQLTNIRAVATSIQTEQLARSLGIPLLDLNEVQSIDLTIDGADEFDTNLALIKGGGGALVREKIIAYLSKRYIIIADSSKQVKTLGKFPLPVEVMPFCLNPILKKLEELGLSPQLRLKNETPFLSDNKNYIIDLNLGQIANPRQLDSFLKSIPGIIDNGLFLGFAPKVIMASMDKITEF